MPIAIFQKVGPNAEQLADAASQATGVPVGFDAEFDSFTFDSDEGDEEELRTVIAEALEDVDAEWRQHLEPVD